MSTLGFDFSPIQQSASQYYKMSVKDEAEIMSREWGITDLSVAQKYGYGLPPWIGGSDKPETLGSLPAPEFHALTGSVKPGRDAAKQKLVRSAIPQGGCQGQALRTMVSAGIAQDTADLSLVGQIGSESFFEARADARVIAIFAKWSACMLSQGYRYADPFGPAAYYASSGKVTKKQIQVAVADIGCKQKIHVLGVASAAKSDYQNRMIHQHMEQLGRYQDRLKQEVGVLARLMDSYGLAG